VKGWATHDQVFKDDSLLPERDDCGRHLDRLGGLDALNCSTKPVPGFCDFKNVWRMSGHASLLRLKKGAAGDLVGVDPD